MTSMTESESFAHPILMNAIGATNGLRIEFL